MTLDGGKSQGWWTAQSLTKAACGVVALSLVGCASAGATAPTSDARPAVVGRARPDLQLTPLNGGKGLRMSELRGKVVLLDVWASWCAPCKQELPMLDDMAGRLRSKGIEIVAVSIDDSREDAETFLRSRPRWTMRLAHDPEGKVPGRLQPPKMP